MPTNPSDPIQEACLLAIKTLNRSFVVTQFIKESLDELHAEISQRKKKRLRVKVPAIGGGLKEIFQPKDIIKSILAESLDSTIYRQAYIASVSTIEDCLATCLRHSLKKHPQKLGSAIDGEKLDKTVGLDQILRSQTLEALIDQLIAARILKIMYDRPLNYFKHLETISGYKIEETLQKKFIEIKASRDIYVHNQSIANAIYVEKAGPSARSVSGEKLPIDENYFAESIGTMKKLAMSILKQAREE